MDERRSSKQLAEALDHLLAKERELLLQGRLDGLADLLQEKESLLDEIGGLAREDVRNIADLHRKVIGNQALLDAALQGLRTVAARMNAMRKIRKSLDTYDERGKRQTIQTPGPRSVERKA